MAQEYETARLQRSAGSSNLRWTSHSPTSALALAASLDGLLDQIVDGLFAVEGKSRHHTGRISRIGDRPVRERLEHIEGQQHDEVVLGDDDAAGRLAGELRVECELKALVERDRFGDGP